MEKTVIFVGGASASGKSTFVNQLRNCIDGSLAYRRVQAFFDYAEYKKIPREDTFKYIKSHDADEWFLNVCKNNNVIISDVHYALQMNRNFKQTNGEVDIYYPYVPTISPSLISELLNNGINVIAVHISCSIETLYQRAIIRNESGERELRAISLEDVMLQVEAERKEWKNVGSFQGVKSIELDSEIFTTEDMVKQFIPLIDSSKKLVYGGIKNKS